MLHRFDMQLIDKMLQKSCDFLVFVAVVTRVSKKSGPVHQKHVDRM